MPGLEQGPPSRRSRACIGFDRAGQDLHQRALPGAVLADQARGPRRHGPRSPRRRGPRVAPNALRTPVIVRRGGPPVADATAATAKGPVGAVNGISGRSMVSRVTRVDARVDPFLHGAASQMCDHRFHAEVSHVERVLQDQSLDLSALQGLHNLGELSNPTNRSPCRRNLRPATRGASRRCVDSLGVKIPSTESFPGAGLRGASRFSLDRYADLGRRPRVLVLR